MGVAVHPDAGPELSGSARVRVADTLGRNGVVSEVAALLGFESPRLLYNFAGVMIGLSLLLGPKNPTPEKLAPKPEFRNVATAGCEPERS